MKTKKRYKGSVRVELRLSFTGVKAKSIHGAANKFEELAESLLVSGICHEARKRKVMVEDTDYDVTAESDPEIDEEE